MGSLGIIIIAGMALGIVDPLFVVPSVYLMVQKLKRTKAPISTPTV